MAFAAAGGRIARNGLGDIARQISPGRLQQLRQMACALLDQAWSGRGRIKVQRFDQRCRQISAQVIEIGGRELLGTIEQRRTALAAKSETRWIIKLAI